MKDRTAVNHKIRKHFNELIYNVARYTEVVLSIVILVVIALAGLRLILTTAGTSVMDMDTSLCGVCKNALPPFRPDRC